MAIVQTNSGMGGVELLLYDTAGLASPALMQNVTIVDNYVAARMADGYLYPVIQQQSCIFNDQGNASAAMPMVSLDGAQSSLMA